ncbi:MAG TPA: hypothetical protein VEC39_15790 [Vicinamibacterales bacterium]|nr:hypothetical protein [Vicinamibacterales bacterium]
MSSPEEIRPARMWRQMPTELRTSAAKAFWADDQAALEQAEAVALIARQIKFRPKSVLTLSTDKKAKHLAGLAQVSDLLAARLVIAYHLAHQRPMMGAFLDLLGIAHDDGLIKDETPKAPDPETLDKAVQELSAKFPKTDVARYFWALLWQDPETWGGLKGRPELALD